MCKSFSEHMAERIPANLLYISNGEANDSV